MQLEFDHMFVTLYRDKPAWICGFSNGTQTTTKNSSADSSMDSSMDNFARNRSQANGFAHIHSSTIFRDCEKLASNPIPLENSELCPRAEKHGSRPSMLGERRN